MSKGQSFYVWDNKNPVSSNDVIRVSGDHPCFMTGDLIKETDDAYWTDEFKAWISERGYQMIQKSHSSNHPCAERMQIIYGEWYAKDESVSGREEANYNNEKWRAYHNM